MDKEMTTKKEKVINKIIFFLIITGMLTLEVFNGLWIPKLIEGALNQIIFGCFTGFFYGLIGIVLIVIFLGEKIYNNDSDKI